MNDKIVSLCGQGNIISLLRWIFKEFKKEVKIRQFDTPENLRNAVDEEEISDLLILDVGVLKKDVLEFVLELHEKRPSLKIILIVFPTTKDEIVKIIRANVVKGIIVRPFTGEVVCNYVDKLL
jgi:DNA-binding NtrC family response regulator